MIFNSIDFAIFLPVVFIAYWFLVNRSLPVQNMLIVTSSYIFYGWWDWRFLSLILFSTIVDFILGLQMKKEKNQKKRLFFLSLSVFINIGFLGFFKYYNFFLDSFVQAFLFFGSNISSDRLNIILPVGISFYTFQTLSYSIDVYKRKLEPTNNFVAFAAFVSFFPQLVAGPIERASNLLPQFYQKRIFNYNKAVDGMRQILWGLFKKIVIADNAALYVNEIFGNYELYSGSTLLIGAIFFSIQIYGDFSGYSDIAIGVSRLFGFNLKKNFAFPYFSRDIAEFWRRWHISLSTWFRDYVYIPLGGSKRSKPRVILNVFIIFILSGFWHGANWTFILWGILNALFFLPLMLLNKNRVNTNIVAEGKYLPSFRELINMLITYSITVIAWIFFRSKSVEIALDYLAIIFSKSLFESPISDIWSLNTGYHIIVLFFMILMLVIIEWFHRNKEHGLEIDPEMPVWRKWIIYYTLIISCFAMNGIQQEFIYFQF